MKRKTTIGLGLVEGTLVARRDMRMRAAMQLVDGKDIKVLIILIDAVQ